MTAGLPHRRVLVYGVTGSGKSTLAVRLGAIAGLPVVLADELTWRPNWEPVPADEQRELFRGIVAEDEWVLDTAYGAWLDVALPRAQLVVGLDYPRWFSLQRLVRRSITRSNDKKPICNGNTESLRLLMRRDSIVVWHFRSFARKRARMRAWASASASASADGPDVLLFSRSRDLEAWVAGLE